MAVILSKKVLDTFGFVNHFSFYHFENCMLCKFQEIQKFVNTKVVEL